MRVLLTGGAGFIGRHVRAALQLRGHQVDVFDSFRPDVHGPNPVVGDAIVGDVRDAQAVLAALVGVDAVVHLAAKVGLGVDAHDMRDYADTNVTGTATVLSAMFDAGVRRLVLASSMVVYGEGVGRCDKHDLVRTAPRRVDDLARAHFEPRCPTCDRSLVPALVDEDAPLDPRNAYAISKLTQEHFAADWSRSTQSSVVALRYHNVYGPGMPRNTPYAGVAAIFLSALREGQAPRVFEDGGQRRDFVHVRDVAGATAAAVDLPSDGVRTFNIGSGVPRTVGDLAHALSVSTGGPAPVVTGEFRLGDVRHITADSARARAELNWQPSVEFEQGVAELAHD
jgi:dTDP-L-rhamnose 4-epimerase